MLKNLILRRFPLLSEDLVAVCRPIDSAAGGSRLTSECVAGRAYRP